MKCNHCGFAPVGECEKLDWNHIFCISCNSIIHFNVLLPDRHLGHCKCGVTVEEKPNGSSVWWRDNDLIIAYGSDEEFSKSSISKLYKEAL